MSVRVRALAANALAANAIALGAMGPVSADTYPRVAGADVYEYVFRLTVSDEADAIEGLATIDVRFDRAGITELPLDLVGRAADGGTGMTVTGVWVADGSAGLAATSPRVTASERGAPVRFEHDGDRLRVALPAPSTAGGRAFITIAYAGTPAKGLVIGPTKHGARSFFSDNWPDKARHWLPTIDHPYDKARSQMIVTAPSHYQVVSNGLLVEETDLGDGARMTHWRQSVPIATWLNALAVARFAVQHLDDFDGKPVQTWVYPEDRDAGFHDFAVPTHAVLAYYSEAIGPYAYEKLANIQSNSVGGGMESASAIFYGDDSVTGERTVRWRNVIIHEIAHHWFGNSVTESDWDDVWLSEGFATYFTLLFREHAYGRDDFVEGLRQARERVFRFYAEHPDYRIVHDELDDMSNVTTGMQYQKGAWTLHMLRHLIGTETFWAGIRAYYAQYRDRNASTADFRRVMEEASGEELDWFFDQWLRQGGVPTIAGTWRYSDGAVRLDLRQTQPDYRFRLPLDVELRFEDGSTQRETVRMVTPAERFTLQADRAPTAVNLDPDTWLLLEVEITREEP
ncbi:MAG: M1 family peptidase [Planctomycetota bacterium]|nr:MAG: M1 family peptidase [Planctomycetota bacterium]